MILAPQQPALSPLKIALSKTDQPAKTIAIYRPKPFERIISRKPKRQSDPYLVPFDQWIMPEQEQGYMKCRRFDFL